MKTARRLGRRGEKWIVAKSSRRWGSAILLTRIIVGIHVLETQRTDGRYLGHVFAGLRPVEVGRVAGQNDDAAGRICFDLVAVEPITEADVENARHERVDPPGVCAASASRRRAP